MTPQLPLFQAPKSKTRESLTNDIWRVYDSPCRDKE
jgi:hypothetical protein